MKKTILEAGINPLDYLDYVPSHYLYGSNISGTFKIPNRIKSIGKHAFYVCASLTSITIPDSVMRIGESAFYNCSSLTNVTIGNGVKSIGKYAFVNCDELVSITYKDTKKRWQKIKKNLYWKSDSNIEMINCTDGDLTL